LFEKVIVIGEDFLSCRKKAEKIKTMKKLTNTLAWYVKLVGRRRKGRCAANHIQILTVIGYTLREYYSQVKGKDEDVIDLLDLPFEVAERCPLCGGEGLCTVHRLLFSRGN
jgi:hypothetical protein